MMQNLHFKPITDSLTLVKTSAESFRVIQIQYYWQKTVIKTISISI